MPPTPLAERIAAALTDFEAKHGIEEPLRVICAEVAASADAPGGTGWSVYLHIDGARLEIPITAEDHIAAALGATVH